jgi:hypothetical protein
VLIAPAGTFHASGMFPDLKNTFYGVRIANEIDD